MILFSVLPMVAQAQVGGRSSWVLTLINRKSKVVAGFTSGFLLHVGERSATLYGGLTALTRSEGLADMRLELYHVLPADTAFAAMAGKLGLSKDSAWALVNVDKGLLMQGTALPDAAVLRQALEDVGIKSPVRVLRDFLKRHPGHIDARVQLLQVLRETAEERTKQALRLEDIESPKKSSSTVVIFDTSALDGKKLSPEQDIVIWAPYAQELETLFTSGDWRFVRNFVNFEQAPVEVCSPTMVGFYGRHIGMVEQSLEDNPTAEMVWELYGWMYSILKRGSAKSLLERMTPPPTNLDWPSGEPLNYLIEQERAKGNWGAIALTLWQKWPATRLRARGKADYYYSLFRHNPPNIFRITMGPIVDGIWNSDVKPLLESLIKNNRVQDAEDVMRDLAKLTAFRDFQRRAAELALECGREDLQKAWLALQISEKPKGADLDDLDVELGIHANSRLILAVVNSEQFGSQIRSLINQDRIIGYDLSTAVLDAKYSELLQKREGWPKKEIHWALFDNKGKTLAEG
jgi:hypothetical protein